MIFRLFWVCWLELFVWTYLFLLGLFRLSPFKCVWVAFGLMRLWVLMRASLHGLDRRSGRVATPVGQPSGHLRSWRHVQVVPYGAPMPIERAWSVLIPAGCLQAHPSLTLQAACTCRMSAWCGQLVFTAFLGFFLLVFPLLLFGSLFLYSFSSSLGILWSKKGGFVGLVLLSLEPQDPSIFFLCDLEINISSSSLLLDG